ncbi:Listeria/Bacterioides repeat-containing protein [[Clostridium] propionicum DSM 1682]|uniref:Endo-1,4-beta-xylanase A n=2 Tax=Anaerotignum propionicum TaxID=28446 RepID=A0A0X1U8K8_ANAPI|nr:endo-1,4-beta-xylanase A precursor [Anaerotignum propionicum DSM 1682]SHF06864.1 Listeria/Bacterioides repeat-containing protein [[Clostridium] propionicum DSM 1682] [Anaerotignum propionicum DSM 1682]
MKRILSMFLALCMVMTLLPVSAMAEEIHTPMDTSGEIISFVPLAETEKKVSPSTSTEDLELPEKLTATVRIAMPIKEGSVQDSENPETTTTTTVAQQEWVETTVDIPVKWESAPEFDMNIEGEYVFTPVIKGYTVSAPLPRITVTVGEPASAALGIQPLAMNAGDVAAIGEKGYATLQAALDAVADGDTIQLLENIDLTDTVIIASGSTKSFILDLNGKTLNGGNAIAIQHNGGTLTVDDTEGGGKVTSMVADGTIHLNGGSLVIISGTVENTNTSKSCAAVSNNNSGSVLVNGGTVTAPGSYGFGIANHSTSSVSVSDGTVSSGFRAIINNSNGKVSISGGEVKLTGSSAGQAIANMWDGEVSVSSGVVDGGKGTGIYNDSTGKIVIPSGSPIIKGETCAMDIAPDLSDYTNVEITASTEYSGLPTTAYDVGAIATYKYLTLAEGGTVTNVAQIGSTSYLTLQAAIDAAVDGQTVTLLANITADSGISAVVLATDKEITLNLNGYTISGSSESVSTILINTSGATLTIEDSAGGGTVSASGGQVDSGNPAGTAVECAYGNLIINGGRIYSRYGNAVFVQSGGTATINGGTINSDGSSFTTIYITGGSYFNICGGTIDSKYTALNSIINIINVNVSSGSAIVKGNSRALFSSTINIDTGTQATASTEYDGSSPVAYDPEKKYDYKYLKFEPAPTVSEQFNLAPGGTYYFDLSSEKSNIGTVNTALPDISLHYVPFTYAGTVNAYSLASQMTTTEVYANANKFDRSLFVGDYVIGRSISWNSLNTNGLIFGKDFDTNYKLRSLSAGSSKVGYKDDSSDHIGQPNFNEWDQILKKSNSDGYATEWIKNWNGLYSWGQDSSSNASRSVRRGYNSVHYWGSNDISYTTDMGFRPALEVLNPVTLGSEGLKVVTLNLNGGKLKENTAPIQIICTGDEFTAPSGEGLTAPVGKTFDGWKDTSGTTYHAGATVSDSVTGLTAQWSAPPVVTSVAVPTNGTYSAGNNLEFTVNFSENVNVTGTPALSLTVGSQTRLADYASGSGTSALLFCYTVKGDDSDSDGISVGSLNLNGGTIKDTAGKNATLTLNSVGITSGVIVNATGAAITTVATADFVSSDQIIVFPAVASHNPGNQTIEYAISLSNLTAPTTGWQTGLSFASIMHSTTYYIWARTAAKPGYNAGTAVASAAITTAPPVNASISPISATFDLNPNGANYKDIDITLTQGSYNCMSIKNGGVPLLIMSHYSVNGNIYTLKKSYLSSLGEGATIITFQMSGGTSPALELTIVDTRTELTSVSISNTAPTFGDTLSATILPSCATVSCSWKVNGSQVGTDATYEVKAADIGKTITLTVTGTGAYKGTITSIATFAVAAKDYSITVGSAKSVAQGSGLSSLPTANSATANGTLTWYSNSECTIAALDTDISSLSVGGSVTLYWSFTATTAGYVTTPKTGSCVVTIVSGTAQTLSFEESAVTKTVGDPVFTNALTHSVGTGAVTYSSSNGGVATVHPTNGAVAIVGAGTTTITANAAMVPGEYAPGIASFTLTVNNTPIKIVSVSSQIGTATAGTAGSLTYTVTTENIANGIYAVSVANLPTGVTVGNSGNVTVSGNSGTLTLTVADTAVAGTTGTLVLTLDGTTSTAFSVVIEEPAAANYLTVTFNPNGGTVSEASRSVAPGTAVGALPTPTHSGSYSFNGWYTAASGGTQISASTTVSANVTYYAHWTFIGGGGSGSGGGSSSNDNSSTVIIIPPTADKPTAPTQGEIKVPAMADGKGNVTVNITDKIVTHAFDKAYADAKKSGNEQNGIAVVLRAGLNSNTASHVTINLPKTAQDTIIQRNIVNTIVVVDNPNIKIGMDLATVKEINKQASTDVNITATRPDNSKLTDDAKRVIGSRPVFDLNVNYGSGKQVENFGEGNVLVTIPYTLGENEKAENVCAVYVNVNGSVEWLTDSIFDSREKVLRFSTNHFSTYGVGYKQPSTAFMDIEDNWAKENIAFVVERGLFSGTSDHTFSPNMTITRGMFVTVLGRLANADVSNHKHSSFTDVKSNAYYIGYIEWARENSIVKGSGNGKFAPDQSISREQMAVIMNNYAKTMNIKLPQVQAENIFADSTKISAYANDAVKQGQILGILSGKNGNLFDPQGTATRAEVSAVLSRFVKLMDSSDTM